MADGGWRMADGCSVHSWRLPLRTVWVYRGHSPSPLSVGFLTPPLHHHTPLPRRRYLACFMVLLLCTLQVLHVWWWCMFLWMMYSFTQTKVAIDMQARTDDKDTMAMQDSQADKAVKVE